MTSPQLPEFRSLLQSLANAIAAMYHRSWQTIEQHEAAEREVRRIAREIVEMYRSRPTILAEAFGVAASTRDQGASRQQ